MTETIYCNAEVHKCDKCGLPTIKRYKVLAPSLDEKNRTLWLCGLCFKALSKIVTLEEIEDVKSE